VSKKRWDGVMKWVEYLKAPTVPIPAAVQQQVDVWTTRAGADAWTDDWTGQEEEGGSEG
jgi:hypothetical protein